MRRKQQHDRHWTLGRKKTLGKKQNAAAEAPGLQGRQCPEFEGLENRTQPAGTPRLKLLLHLLQPQLPHQEQHCHFIRASSSATYQCSSWDRQRRARKHMDAFPCCFQGRIAQAWIPPGLGRSQDLYAGHKLRQQHLCLLVPDILLKRKGKGKRRVKITANKWLPIHNSTVKNRTRLSFTWEIPPLRRC